MRDSESECDALNRTYDWEEVEPAVAIVELIADLERGEATEPSSFLDRPLYSYVETDALNDLVRNENLVSITLRISHYHVEIRGNTLQVSTTEE